MYNINDVLLIHVTSGGGPAIERLRNEILLQSLSKNKNGYFDFIRILTAFFSARTDIRRLIYAQQASEIILNTHDMSELIGIRSIVADLELKRIIAYKKHRDHTAHTLYLYILGIWLYDTIPSILKSFASNPKLQHYTEWYISEIFLLQWLFASLLHDVGYIFSELNENTTGDRAKIEKLYDFELFRSEVLKDHDHSDERVQKELFKIHNRFNELYGNNWPQKVSATNDPIEILKAISYMPWIADLGFKDKMHNVFRLFDTSNRNANYLESFAYSVSKSGYKNSVPTVDHAVASGLLLLQYSTYWYWLVNSTDKRNALFSNWGGYSVKNIPFIIEACRAVAYHNIKLKASEAKFNNVEDPILYLGILCDEICIWERFPASSDISEIWNQSNFLESPDIMLSSEPYFPEGFALFKIANANFDLNNITKNLDSKLIEWNEIVRFRT